MTWDVDEVQLLWRITGVVPWHCLICNQASQFSAGVVRSLLDKRKRTSTFVWRHVERHWATWTVDRWIQRDSLRVRMWGGNVRIPGLHVLMCPVTSARYGMFRRRGDCETTTSFIMVAAGCDWWLLIGDWLVTGTVVCSVDSLYGTLSLRAFTHSDSLCVTSSWWRETDWWVWNGRVVDVPSYRVEDGRLHDVSRPRWRWRPVTVLSLNFR